MKKREKILAFIGSYADSNNPGLYTCEYDARSGNLELLNQVSGLKNPTFLDVDEHNKRLYTLAEGVDSKDQRCGLAAAYDIEPSSGKLSLINIEVSVPVPACHITLDRTNQSLLVSSYHGGMIGMSPLLEDGRIGPIADIQRHKGSSILPVQDRPRAHSTFIDRLNRYAVVCDLGLDRIFLYKLELSTYRFIPHGEVQVAPGSGPRHFVFHPSLSYGYVINELNATITAFTYDEDQGELSEIQTVSTLPDSYKGENSCADIHISPDGKFLYGSNRGHNSIAVYEIDLLSGQLALVEYASTMGEHPRNFAISPDGHFLLAANRDSDSIVTFNRDLYSGKLTPTGDSLNVSMPVCIKFAYF
ncbi:lactonase family protein [Cohnella sp.]|uniref:lactonase family protein n=1 Tax=Cohnella sp. TaxID=1883426 RepID=UPI0035664C20